MKNKRLVGLLGVLLIVITAGFALPQPNKYGIELKEIEFNPFPTEHAQTKEDVLQKRYMLVEFFTLQCPYCVASIPALNELNKHKDLSVVAYIMSSSSKVKKYAKKHNVEYTVCRATPSYMDTFQPSAVPMSFLIDTKTLEVKQKFVGKVSKEKVLSHL